MVKINTIFAANIVITLTIAAVASKFPKPGINKSICILCGLQFVKLLLVNSLQVGIVGLTMGLSGFALSRPSV